jgi:hypothetical protein
MTSWTPSISWIQLSASVPSYLGSKAERIGKSAGTGAMIKHIERFMSDNRAAAAVEYALIAGGLAAAIAVVALRLAIK